MASANGLVNNNLAVNTLDGLTTVYTSGGAVDPSLYVKYTGNTNNTDLGTFDLQTLGTLSGQQLVLPLFGSTMMTGPTTSSIFYAHSWKLNNTITISSLGSGNYLSTSYLRINDVTNASTLLTLQSNGVADFGGSIPRASTIATGNYDLINLSTLSNAVAFITNVNALNYVPYSNPLQNLDMAGSTIKTTGYVSTAYLTLSQATNSEAWTLYTLSTMGNLSSLGGLIIQETTSGNSVYLTGGVVGAKNFQFSSPGGGNAGKVVCTDGNSVMSTTISAGQLGYITSLTSQAGGIGQTNTWTNTQTFSVAPTLNSLTTTTPSFSLGVDGSNQVIKFTASGGTVNTSSTTARFLPYLSTATTLTNSLLNQIDNDSIGMGYTAIPNYPLGSSKNMYVNGSIFAGGLNSMVGTFGRDTNTSNPANEITFTAGGAGVLLTQVKSHSGSSAFVDATWTYSNTNPVPLGANQGQVLLQADNLQCSLRTGFSAIVPQFTINNTLTTTSNNASFTLRNNVANPSIFNVIQKSAGSGAYHSLTQAGDTLFLSMDQQNGVTGANGIVIAGWGQTAGLRIGTTTSQFTGALTVTNDVLANGVTINGGGTYQAGCIYTDVNWGMLFRAKVPGVNSAYGFHNSVGTQLMNITNGGILTAGQPGTAVIIGDTSQGQIRWVNPNGSITHWGYPSGGGSDNYIRGTLTYIDTPIVFNNTMAIASLPQNTSVYSQVMTLNPTTSAVQKSQAMQRKLIDYYGGWGGGYNVVNAFYKFNSLVPVRLHGFYSGYWSSAYMGYAQIRIYSQVGANYIFKVLPTFTNNGGNHVTIPMDVVFDSSVLPNTGWHDIYITNYAGINTDANDVLMVNVTLLPVDSF